MSADPVEAAPMPSSMADLPPQEARDAETDAQARARFFNSGNAFNIKLSDVPNAVFAEEPARALAGNAPTGFTACDRSDQLGCGFEATTPLILARYARINAGEVLTEDARATGVIHYVIQGTGKTLAAGEPVAWAPGDVFVVPGGRIRHEADETAVLWTVSNAPHLAFEHTRPPAEEDVPTGVVHYTADEIERQVDLLYKVGTEESIAGIALVFSSDRQMDGRNILPTLTLAMNTLPPGGAQRAHKHNAVAVALVVQGKDCYSMINGERKDWAPWATTITPPTSVHSHHNDGPERATFLIVQDGGLYYHARAMGFEFTE